MSAIQDILLQLVGCYKFCHWHVTLVLSASLGLGYLARSLAALVLDVIFGNYTLTYIYIVVSFFHPLSSFLVFFLITLLLVSFLSFFSITFHC